MPDHPSIIPLQLPPRLLHFTGRETELKSLLKVLQLHRVTTLYGAAGVGKTALVIEAIYRLIEEENTPPTGFPDGVIFHDFYKEPSAETALINIAKVYKATTQGTADKMAESALVGKKTLLVFDGAECCDDLKRILAITLLDSCGTVITSQNPQDTHRKKYEIETLAQDDAVTLLYKLAEQHIDNEDSAKNICELVGGLPLAIQLVGQHLNKTGETSSYYLKSLEANPLDALELEGAQHRHESIRLSLQPSFAKLTDNEQQILSVFNCLAKEPVSLYAVLMDALGYEGKTGVYGVLENIWHILGILIDFIIRTDITYNRSVKQIEEIKQSIDELVNLGLLKNLGGADFPLYEFTHPLIHAYASEQFTLSDASFINLIEWCEEFIEDAIEDEEDDDLLMSQCAHIVSIIQYAHQRQAWQVVATLAGLMEPFLAKHAYQTERKQILELGIEAFQVLKQRSNEGVFSGNLGLLYQNLHQVDKAETCYKQALNIAQEEQDEANQSVWLANLGSLYQNTDKFDEAIDCSQQALVLAEKLGNQYIQAACLGSLGFIYKELDELEKSIEYSQQALSLAKELDDYRSKSVSFGNLGLSYKKLGEIEKAIEYYKYALVAANNAGDKQVQSVWLGNLGAAYKALDKSNKAIESIKQAFTLAQEMGDQRVQGILLGNLGCLYKELGQQDKAMHYAKEGLEITLKSNDKKNQIICLGSLSCVYADLGDADQAIKYAQKSLAVAKEIAHKELEGEALSNFGEVYEKLGQHKKACVCYQDALDILEKVKYPNPSVLNLTRTNLSKVSVNT